MFSICRNYQLTRFQSAVISLISLSSVESNFYRWLKYRANYIEKWENKHRSLSETRYYTAWWRTDLTDGQTSTRFYISYFTFFSWSYSVCSWLTYLGLSTCHHSITLRTLHCVQKKNTHSRFLLYLRGKCLDLHKIFRVYLRGIAYATDVKTKYFLLPMT